RAVSAPPRAGATRPLRDRGVRRSVDAGESGLSGAPAAHAHILAVVRRIPRGRVVTYGQVAALAGLPGHARLVGYALHALPEGSRVPWQRVINAKGEVSARAVPGYEGYQRAVLKREGVRFDARGR